MQAKIIKQLFETGMLAGVNILPEPMSRGWVLSFMLKGGGNAVLETARGGTRVFSSLDTAVSSIEGITGRKPTSMVCGV